MDTDAVEHELLHDILKQVSRSFYLTLNVLPAGVRDQMGLSYLFARAADTIADTDLIDRTQRLKYLNQFRAQFTTAEIDWKIRQRDSNRADSSPERLCGSHSSSAAGRLFETV